MQTWKKFPNLVESRTGQKVMTFLSKGDSYMCDGKILMIDKFQFGSVWEYNVTQQKFIVIQQEIDERLALSSFVFATIYLTLELDF